jgi:hypothetical protein
VTGAPRDVYASQDFIIVSKAAVRALGNWALAGCFQRIAWRCQREGSWRATMAEIAEEICVSERTAKRLTDKLRELEWITGERENTWESTLTWKVVWQHESANVAPTAEDDEPAGQEPEGQTDTDESANMASPGVPNVALPAEANVALGQEANLASSPFSQTAKTNNETAGDSLRSSPAPAGSQEALVAVTGGASSTRATGSKKKSGKKSESPYWPQAEAIAQPWWDWYQAQYGQITRVGSGSPYIALRDNVILPALEAEWTEDEIKQALLRAPSSSGIPDAVPDKQRFQRSLAEVRAGAPAPGQRRPNNVHQLAPGSADHETLVQAFNG